MLRENTFFGFRDKVATAIARIRQFCPPEGYYLAFSGGKDSMVIKRLADMAITKSRASNAMGMPLKARYSSREYHKYMESVIEVSYDAHFNMTTVDPPEVLNFIRDYYPDVAMERPEETMWQLIVRKRMPPTRRVRYCCEILKERGGIGRVVMTGIRWEESGARKKRQMVETCYKDTSKRYVHPIIDWTEEDVWEFIRAEELPYCSLYDEGFKRIGCVLCPMYRGRKNDIERFPGFYKAYLRAFEKMLEARKERGLDTVRWETAQDVINWWLSDEKGVYDSRQSVFSID